jgi:DnaJ-class molecular chaperone
MSTWWRQARRDGKTIVERLDLIARKSFYQLEEMRPYRQRIRSILRRLKRCQRCRGLGVDFLQAEKISIVVCEVCGGTGRVKEEI